MLAPALPLITARMTLRPYEDRDLGGLHDLFGRADVLRYHEWEPMGLDDARTLLERRVSQTRIEADGDGIVLAAVDTGSGRMIGEFGIWVRSLANRQGEIGYAIHPDQQGRGLATEGGRELLRLGFDVLALHRIVADTDARNAASLKVMARLGMRREALFSENVFYKGEWSSTVVCAIRASEWRVGSESRAAGE